MVTLVDVDATWVNPSSVSYDAVELRGADAAIYSHTGIVRDSDTALDVTVDASDNVTVQPGPVAIPGNAVTGGGVYRAALRAIAAGLLESRDATNPRVDLVVFRQLDTDVVGSHAAYTARLEIIKGEPSATPSAPALPFMAVEVGRLTVPASGAGAASVDLTHRTYACAVGGVLAVPTAARLPATALPHQRAIALDTGVGHRFDGTDWFPDVQGATIYNAGTAPDITTGGADKELTVLTTAERDDGGLHPDGTSSIVIRETGWHDVSAQVVWSQHGTGIRYSRIMKNQSVILVEDRQNATAGTNTVNSCGRSVYLQAGDLVTLAVWQNSGGTRSVVAGSQNTWLTVARR